MCGLAGWAGIPAKSRYNLTRALGVGIDARGRHSIGYVSDGRIVGRALGTWADVAPSMIRTASGGETALLHARYRTGGKINVQNAHPYTIMRKGRIVLHGAHNGVLDGTEDTAKKYRRHHTVDSRELFELLADGRIEEINDLEGYGVVTWTTPNSHDIRLAKLTDSGEISVCRLRDGGIVYASTEDILIDALVAAELVPEDVYELETGRVYRISPAGITTTPIDGLTVQDWWSATPTIDDRWIDRDDPFFWSDRYVSDDR